MRRTLIIILAIASVSRAITSSIQIAYGLPSSLTWWPWGTWTGPILWHDFSEYYLPQLQHLSQGFLPYRDFGYSYLPLFLYSLFPFYYLGGGYAAAIPIVVSDALTAPLIYLIVIKVASKRVALVAGLAYALSPIALVSEGYLWLSGQPMTFFIILAIYLHRDNRPLLSIISLATAFLFKQEVLFVLLPYLFFYVRGHGKKALKGVGLFITIIFVVVSPFLILEPVVFIHSTAYYFPLDIGPIEPSRLATGAGNSLPSVLIATKHCTNTIITNFYTGAICGTNVNMQELPPLLLEEKIFAAASLLEPVLFIIFLVGLFAARRSPNILELASAYSIVGFLVIFSQLVHSSYAYYFIPVYALMLASATNRRNLAVGVFGASASALISENIFQTILPMILLFAIVVIYDKESARRTSEHRGIISLIRRHIGRFL